MADIAKLGFEIDSSDAISAEKNLSKLTSTSENLEKSATGTQRSIRRLENEINGLNKTSSATDTIIKRFNNFISSMFSPSLSKLVPLITSLSIGFAGISSVSGAINTVVDFSSSLSNLSAITGAVGEDLQFLSEQAIDIGSTTTLSASQASEAFKLVASARPELLESAEALNQVTREAVTLAEAARIDLPLAAQVLGTSLNQFSAASSEASRFINVLAAGAKFGSSEISNTALALRDSATVAAAANISFEQLNAAIQVLAESGTQGSMAGTVLRNVIAILQTQTNAFNPAVVGLSQALENLRDENLSTAEAVKIFGRENFVAAQNLINNVDLFDQLNDRLTGTRTAYEQASINTNNLSGDFMALRSSVEGLVLSFGGTGEGLRPIIQAATSAIKGIADSSDEIITVFESLATVYALSLTPAIVTNTAAIFANQAALLRFSAVDVALIAAQARLSAISLLTANLPTLLAVGFGTIAIMAIKQWREDVRIAGEITEQTTKAIMDANKASKNIFDDQSLSTFRSSLMQINQEIMDAEQLIRDIDIRRKQRSTTGIISDRPDDEQQAAQDRINKLRLEQEKLNISIDIASGNQEKYNQTLEFFVSAASIANNGLKSIGIELFAVNEGIEQTSEMTKTLVMATDEEIESFNKLASSLDPLIADSIRYMESVESINEALKLNIIDQNEANRLIEIAASLYTEAGKEGKKFAEEIEEIIKATESLGLDKTEQDLLKLNIALEEALSSNNEKMAIRISEAIDKIVESQSMLNEEADQKELDNLLDRLGDVESKTREYNEALVILNKALDDGKISQERYSSLLNNLPGLFDTATSNVDVYTSAIERSIERLDDAGQDLWMDFLENGRVSLRGIRNLFLSTLSELAQAAITRPILLNFASSGAMGNGLEGIRNAIFGQGQDANFVGPVRPGALDMILPLLAGAGIGAGVGGTIADGLSSTIGGAIGGAFGEFAATDLFAGSLDFLGGFAGPISSVVFGALGSVLGGIFGGKKPRIRLGGEDAPFTPDDPTDAVFMTALGVVKTELRKLSEEDLQNVIMAVTQFDSVVAEAAGNNRLPQIQDSLRSFFSTAKGKDVSITENLADRFNFIVQSLGPELSGLIGQAGSDIDASLNRFADILAVDRFVAETDLLGNSVSGVVDLLSMLSSGNETLRETLIRVARQSEIFNQSIKSIGISVNESVESVAVVANDIAELFGGIENFASEISRFMQIIGDEISFQDMAISAATAIGQFAEQVGLSEDNIITTRDELNEFVKSLDLTTESGRQALKASLSVAESIAIYEDFSNNIIEQAMLLSDFASSDIIMDYAEGIRASNLSISELLQMSRDEINQLTSSFDGSLSSISELNQAVSNRYSLELQFIRELENSVNSALTTIAGTRQTIEESLLGTEELYERRREQIRALSSQIDQAQTPEEIRNLADEINSLTVDAFNILSESQRQTLGPEFLEFLDSLSLSIEQRRNELENEFLEGAMGVRGDISSIGIDDISIPINMFDGAVNRFSDSVESMINRVVSQPDGNQSNESDIDQVIQSISTAIVNAISTSSESIANTAASTIVETAGNINVVLNIQASDEVV